MTLRWVINDFDVDFNAVDPVGSSNRESIATAHLVDVGVDSTTFVGNRTSLLIIKSNPNFIGYINVSCSAGGLTQECATSVEVIGEYNNYYNGTMICSTHYNTIAI